MPFKLMKWSETPMRKKINLTVVAISLALVVVLRLIFHR